MLSINTFKDAGKLALATIDKKYVGHELPFGYVQLRLIEDEPRLEFSSTDRYSLTRINMPIDDETLAALKAEEVFGEDHTKYRYFNKTILDGIVGVHCSLALSAEILSMHLANEVCFTTTFPNLDRILDKVKNKKPIDFSDVEQVNAFSPMVMGNCFKAIAATAEYKKQLAKLSILFSRDDKTDSNSVKMFVIEPPKANQSESKLADGEKPKYYNWDYVMVIMGSVIDNR